MERLQSNPEQDFDAKHSQRQVETLKTFDNATLDALREDALASHQELESLLASIDLIQSERMQDALF